jgi:hypothetical protein
MATDDRLTIDVGDLLAIQVECSKCGTVISYPPGVWDPPPAEGRCPQCAEFWWEPETSAREAMRTLIRGLRAVRELDEQKERFFRLHFQVRRPDQAQPKPAKKA